MSGAQTSSFMSANDLYNVQAAEGARLQNQLNYQQNPLLLQENQQKIQANQQALGQNEAEMIGRASMGVLSVPADQRPAAYQAAVANLQQYGFAKNAPSEYPGDDRMHQLSMMGIPSADQFKLQQQIAANQALLGNNQPTTGTGTGAGTGVGSVPIPGYGTGGPGANIQMPPEYLDAFRKASAETGIPADLLIAQARQESGFNPNATGRAGEVGLMQIMPSTAQNPGGGMQGVDPASLRDPAANIMFGARYLKAKMGSGDPNDPAVQAAALHSYNGGGDPNYVANVWRYRPTLSPTSPARSVTAYTPPQPSSGAGGTQPVILGDSYASPDGIGGSGMVGAHQPQVLAQIRDQAGRGKLQGKPVVISTGAVNDNGDTSRVAEQVQAAKDGDATSVTVVGVADGAPQSAATNARLQQIAQQSGAQFLPAGPAGKDGIHPANYAPLRQAVRLGGTAAAGSAAGPSPGPTAPAAATPAIPQPTPNDMFPGAKNGAPVPPAQPAPAPTAPPASQVQPPAPPVVRPPAAVPLPPPPPPMDNRYLTQQDYADLRNLGRVATTEQVAAEMDRRAASNVQRANTYQAALEKQRADEIAAQQLILSGANTALEYRKADPEYRGAVAGAEAAAKLPTAIAEAIAKAGVENVNIRPGGTARVMGPDGSQQYVTAPIQGETTDDQGRKIRVMVTPPAPGSTAPAKYMPIVGPDGRPMLAEPAAQEVKGREEAVKEFTGPETASYGAAQNVHAWLGQIEHSANVMNQTPGIFSTGPLSGERYGIMGALNDAARTVGLKDVPFDPQKISSFEEMRKATTTAGFELSSHYEGHARQAAATIMNATSAVPGPANSPQGLQRVSSGIREGAQASMDEHEFKQDVYNTDSSLLQAADTAFWRAHPAEQYTDRAISRTEPIKIQSQSELSKYLPGTFVEIPKVNPATGKNMIVQVPERTEQLNVGGQTIPHQLTIPRYLQGASPYG